MRLVLHNVTVVYFPIWTMPLFGCFSEELYWGIRVLELLLLIPACITTFSFCKIVCQTRIFHYNLSILLVSLLGQWFECFVARILIMPYQEEWIKIGDTVFEVKETGIYQASGVFLPLFIGGFMRTHYILSMAIGGVCLVMERMWASFCIRSYEKRPRIYISTSMILISHLLSIFLSYELIQWKFSYVQIIVTLTIVVSMTLMTFFMLYTYNSIVTRRLERQHRLYGYHFGKRYQAKENLNSLKLVRCLCITTVTALLIISLLTTLVASGLLPTPFHRIALEISEIMMNLNPLYMIPPLAYRIPLWKSKMLTLIPRRFRRKWVGSPRVQPERPNRIQETTTYWTQFTNQW